MEYLPSFSDNLYADIQPSYTDSLVHHGIKGMHWGVRRFQNPDGTLTVQGKNRYSLNPVKRMQQKKQAKDNVRKERLASECEQTSKRYAEYSGKFNKAADTLQREGTHGNSIYMQRMNEYDWSDVYDHGPSHRQALKDVVQELRDCERQTSQWGKAYSDAAKYLRSNPGVSYKDAANYINRNIYDNAEKKYGYDKIDDYSYIIDETV